MPKFEIGDRVRIALKEVIDGIDASIQGKIGIIATEPHFDGDTETPFDYCVIIGKIKFGLMEYELEVVEDD